MNQLDYYRNPYVIDRILDFYHGFEKGRSVRGSKYPVGYGESETWRGNEAAYWSGRRDEDIYTITQEQGLDVFTSLWRDDGTLAVLDIEYFNHDWPGEAYFKPREVFEKIEPVYGVIKDVFHEYGIYPLKVMTGQGYHFTTLWPFSEDHRLLEDIASIEPSLSAQYGAKNVRENEAKGYHGIFRLLHFLSLEVIRRCDEMRASGEMIIPVTFSDLSIGPVGRGIHGHGREAVSLDLTVYSDPIFMRDIRMPFSTHQKHKVQRHKVGEEAARRIPITVCPPRSDMTLDELLSMRRRDDNSHFKEAADYASQVRTTIPRAHEGWKNLLKSYRSSPLAAFHERFDSEEIDHESEWHRTYLALDTRNLPACVAHPIDNPNDHLLKPTNLRTVIAVLDHMDWSPKHIAGLIYSRYSNMMDWGRYNAERKAGFWVEQYLGGIHTGHDTKIDLNCISHAECGFCVRPRCGRNLADYR